MTATPFTHKIGQARTTVPLYDELTPMVPNTQGAGSGPAPGEGYVVVCGPPSGPPTTQTAGSCEWVEAQSGCGAACQAAKAARHVVDLGVAAQNLAGDIASCARGDVVDQVNCLARLLSRSGSGGELARDSINGPITAVARAAALSQGGVCYDGPRGLQVCVVPPDADVTIRLTPTVGPSAEIAVELYSRRGNTIGNVFITADETVLGDPDFLEHEVFHTFQWAAAAGVPFAALYAVEYARAGGICNRFERAADFTKGNYPQCVR